MGREESLLVVYKVAVSSSTSLSHQGVTQALTHLYRKVPSLRVCLKEREDGVKWFKEMSPENNIDFEVKTENSVEEVAQELNTYKYNSSEGPLWCVRLVPVAESVVYHPTRFSSFCGDLQTDFPHCYYFMFGFNHCMGDGHSYRNIIGHFISILDDVLSGTSISDQEQLGKFVLNEAFDETLNTHMFEMMNDPALKHKYVEESQKGQPEKPLLEMLVPTPLHGPDRKTLLISQAFDSDVTDKFMRQCKEHQISVNSGLTAAGILGFVQLLSEEGIDQDTYSVSTAHLINVRRFWDPVKVKDNLGCYIGLIGRHFTQTPKTVSNKKEFWTFAKGVHTDFYNDLNSSDVLYRLAFAHVCLRLQEPHLDRDLTFNTLGNLTSTFAGRKHLHVTHFVNTSSIHNTPIVWDHISCTIRGRLLHSIKFRSGRVPLVVIYLDKIFVMSGWYREHMRDIHEARCPLPCKVTTDRTKTRMADAVLVHLLSIKSREKLLQDLTPRDPTQPWIMFEPETPFNGNVFFFNQYHTLNGIFNRTMHYRRDSDIQLLHGFIVRRGEEVNVLPPAWRRPPLLHDHNTNYTSRHLAVAFISNCNDHSWRLKYIHALQDHTGSSVHVVGKCGTIKCGQSMYAFHGYRVDLDQCLSQAGHNYLFYLAFENALCEDYVTEKLYNLMYYPIVPVVYGAADYTKILPPHSYINAMDYKPQQLAQRLLYLASHIEEYKEYLAWRQYYQSSTVGGSRILCDLCTKLHHQDLYRYNVVQDFKDWYVTKAKCSSGVNTTYTTNNNNNNNNNNTVNTRSIV
ncbi:hypothetical protein Pmani_020467 [Petrolisthes manimaculis]|uniref:Fucosyltransferase n=1 Tax=Petrolisthes manimaculis TaxID=1843537 RepID=A0AAE1PIC0_9EUCA|nr:hypothetical protein Pmani_020467 [Petrolisthes manimaculis]